MTSPRRLIEVDLPIRRISEHARREKSIRHGHISTLHIWWARRPLAACRAVLCAALWPDPVDVSEAEAEAARRRGEEIAPNTCPPEFREEARRLLVDRARRWAEKGSAESLKRLLATRKDATILDRPEEVREGLLDFIADFANWDSSTDADYLQMARTLTQVAHESMGGIPGTRPLVVDPFAGGGSIPLEALRVGADAFASDLNPVAVLLNKVVLEYIPRYGQRLADEVRRWGEWVGQQAAKELAEFYPPDPDGSTPIAYLWARTILCEGPGCGAEVPLIRSLWLGKKPGNSWALRWQRDDRGRVKGEEVEVSYADGTTRKVVQPLLEVFQPTGTSGVEGATVARGSGTCPMCGFTTPVVSVRRQLKSRGGGTSDARLFAVVLTRQPERGRRYRTATMADYNAARAAESALQTRLALPERQLPLSPTEPLPPHGTLGFRVQPYGMLQWAHLYTPRQLLTLSVLAQSVQNLENVHGGQQVPAVQSILALAVSRLADRASSLCTWRPQADQEKVEHVFTRQALPMTWDFAEGVPITGGTAGWLDAYEPPSEVVENVGSLEIPEGAVTQSCATEQTISDGMVSLLFSDPPYYDAIPYADLSDYFYVWLRRTLHTAHSASFSEDLTAKGAECIVDPGRGKSKEYFESRMCEAMSESRRTLNPSGLGVVVFAHKSTSGWEAQLQAMSDARWTMVASWPIDTEMGNRLRAMNSAALASSVHLVCRPRPKSPDGQPLIGDYRDVLQELPRKIHAWLPRLAREGVVGADAIFACLGPALEVFSRYDRVEKPSGEIVALREYLEHVWAEISREALSTIFSDADASGFEEDARLTAMWLWTLTGGAAADAATEEDEGDEEDEDAPKAAARQKGGYVLEFDTARKIAQGLGAHLERLITLVEVKGEKARLLPVRERTRPLFGKDAPQDTGRKKRGEQLRLFSQTEHAVAEPEPEEYAIDTWQAGATVLDRVHQAMLLFGLGRGERLRSFLVDDGVGRQAGFWRLAQSLSALYPTGSEEKRWVDGVLARKKGLGL